jgi:hypothetical protein
MSPKEAPGERTCAELEAEAYDHEAKAATLRAEAVRARAVEQQHQCAPSIVKVEPMLLSPRDLARRLGVSVAHVRRLDPPGVVVGDKSTKRYDLDEVRAWLRDREPRATTPVKKASAANDDDLDVSSAMTAAGLHRVRDPGEPEEAFPATKRRPK